MCYVRSDESQMDAQQPWKKGGTASWVVAAGALESGDLEPRLQLLRDHADHCLPATLKMATLTYLTSLSCILCICIVFHMHPLRKGSGCWINGGCL